MHERITMTSKQLDLDAILDRAGECRVLEDIRDLVAEVRRLRETARRAEHMEDVMARIPADVLERAVREATRRPSSDR